MNKKYVRGFDEYKKSIKEGMNIYEFEDDVADLDSDTAKAESSDLPEDSEPAAPTTEVPVEAPVAPTEDVVEEPAAEETPDLDFGDNGANLSVEELTSKLDFISGVVDEYKKLIKNDGSIDSKTQSRIKSTFDALN